MPPIDPQARANALRELTDRIRAAEVHAPAAEGSHAVQTGWASVDRALPEHGLRRGATHELLGCACDPTTARRMADWDPPLVLLTRLAAFAAGAEGWTIWIGPRVWSRSASTTTLQRSLFVDPPDAGARDWALDAALRCPGLTVVADGTGLDAAASRRIQLAAEAGGSVGLVARPPWDAGEITFAWTRWTVTHAPHAGESLTSRWNIKLVRCKGMQRLDSHHWTIERNTRGGVVALSPEVADRPGASVAAS
jgi:protein ImuA